MADEDGTMVDAEEVWAAITSQFQQLQGDIVCVIPDPKLKNKLKEKFKSHEGPLKAAFTSKMEQFVKANEPEDHSACDRRIKDLEADLDNTDTALKAQLQRVVLLSQTIKDLREELQNNGIRRPFSGHLQ
ncbi:hypothetical protein AAVH_04202 [Aphelenchoides avenae]|nr:hypothetical protein AAVH_04202 [Aphelenchus avenae]